MGRVDQGGDKNPDVAYLKNKIKSPHHKIMMRLRDRAFPFDWTLFETLAYSAEDPGSIRNPMTHAARSKLIYC